MKHHDLLIFRVIEYGINHKFFSFTELEEALKLNVLERKYVWNTLTCYLQTFTDNPNHVIVLVVNSQYIDGQYVEVMNVQDYTFSLLPTAIVQYVDYLEIVEARRNSKQAFIISLLAIGISIAIGAVQIYYQVNTVATNATGN